jgi:hypothetical protein
MRHGWLVVGAGVLLVLVGVVWTLQGVGVMGGSAMSGHARWAVVGPVVVLGGAVLLGQGKRSRRP